MTRSAKFTFISVLLLIVSCSSSDLKDSDQDSNNSTFVSDEETMNRLSVEIMNIIKDKSCNTTVTGACKTIAFGAKACGGPKEFLIYNSSQVDESLLIEKVKTYNKLQDEFNKREGVFSDCMVVIQPVVGCVDGNCAVVQ
jgi:hypothetical protein